MTRLVPALLALLVACAGETEPPAARSPTPPVTAEPTTPVPTETTPTPDETTPGEPSAEDGEPILIETRVSLPEGDVLPGSLIGESAFCPGGTFRDEHGEPPLGLVLKTFQCPDGRLTITFSPTQHSSIQSSSWRVVEGSGEFEGLSGQGWMVGRFEEGDPAGRETFTGTVIR
jgi:hypothetical protein